MRFINLVALTSPLFAGIGHAVGIPQTAVSLAKRDIDVHVSVLVQTHLTTCQSIDTSINALLGDPIVVADLNVRLNALLKAFVDLNAILTGHILIDVHTAAQIKALAAVLVSIYADVGDVLAHISEIPELDPYQPLIISIGVQAKVLLTKLDVIVPGILGFVQAHLGITGGLVGTVEGVLQGTWIYVDQLLEGLLTCTSCASKCLCEL